MLHNFQCGKVRATVGAVWSACGAVAKVIEDKVIDSDLYSHDPGEGSRRSLKSCQGSSSRNRVFQRELPSQKKG